MFIVNLCLCIWIDYVLYKHLFVYSHWACRILMADKFSCRLSEADNKWCIQKEEWVEWDEGKSQSKTLIKKSKIYVRAWGYIYFVINKEAFSQVVFNIQKWKNIKCLLPSEKIKFQFILVTQVQ